MLETLETKPREKMTVDINELMHMLSVGKNTAYKVGKESGAAIRIGRRVLFNVSKVRDYINGLGA